VSEAELVALVCCDLGGIVRGRSVFASELGDHLEQGIGWVPANQALTPLGPVAEPNPFGSTGDLRLLPDASTRVRVPTAAETAEPLEFLLCDIVETDGTPWRCCTRSLLRETLAEIERELGLSVLASFEHEFQLLREGSAALPFSLEAQRRGEPFATHVMIALREAGAEPERFFPEYASHQFEIPVAPARGVEAADRALVLREVVREVARREGERATFVPLLDPEEAGNGVHVHMSLSAADGGPALYDATREGGLSQLGGSFAAGILAHAPALSALTAPSPVSAPRLQPHRWSAGAACLAVRNREALLRIPPLLSLDGAEAAGQMRLEYRGADAAANPHLALAAILKAGLEGVRRGLPAPAILDRDPADLSPEESRRFGVGALPSSLEEALAALEGDQRAASWLPPMLLEAYTSVKRYELEATTRLDLGEICRRYAAIY
jgi:glutamine synthetase